MYFKVGTSRNDERKLIGKKIGHWFQDGRLRFGYTQLQTVSSDDRKRVYSQREHIFKNFNCPTRE